MITKEALEAKKAQLAKQLEELRANMLAVSGAIQLCDVLLSDISQTPDPRMTPPPLKSQIP